MSTSLYVLFSFYFSFLLLLYDYFFFHKFHAKKSVWNCIVPCTCACMAWEFFLWQHSKINLEKNMIPHIFLVNSSQVDPSRLILWPLILISGLNLLTIVCVLRGLPTISPQLIMVGGPTQRGGCCEYSPWSWIHNVNSSIAKVKM